MSTGLGVNGAQNVFMFISEIMENLEPCEDKDTAKLITGKVRI
jgi:hypothetical protein